MPALLGHPLRVFLWTAKGAALLHVAFAHGYSAAPGWGPSMLPTFLVDGQWFAVDRGARRGRGVAVGDCVLYAIPVVGAAERRYVLCFIFIFILFFLLCKIYIQNLYWTFSLQLFFFWLGGIFFFRFYETLHVLRR